MVHLLILYTHFKPVMYGMVDGSTDVNILAVRFL